VFSEKKLFLKDGVFKASNLERAIKGVVEDALGKGRAEERMFEARAEGSKLCRTYAEFHTLTNSPSCKFNFRNL
jgi:hypothetical protein